MEKISNASALMVGLERRARRRRGILGLIVFARIKEYAKKVETISSASAMMVGRERPAQRGILAISIMILAISEYARKVEKIFNASVNVVTLERPARRGRTSARECHAPTTGGVSQRTRAQGSFLGADATLALPAVHVKTMFARECRAATTGSANQ